MGRKVRLLMKRLKSEICFLRFKAMFCLVTWKLSNKETQSDFHHNYLKEKQEMFKRTESHVFSIRKNMTVFIKKSF